MSASTAAVNGATLPPEVGDAAGHSGKSARKSGKPKSADTAGRDDAADGADDVPAVEEPESAWTVCTDAAERASVEGFSVRRHTSGFLRLWRDETGEEPAHVVGAPLWLRGMAADEHGCGWRTVVDYVDHNGAVRRWLMPRSHLAGDARELLRELLDRGYDPTRGRKARDALFHYVGEAPRGRFTTTERTGWHGESFVLPAGAVGPGAYLLANMPAATTLPGGTLARWRRDVAMPCRGNTRLAFALSTALASPLLELADMESGGVHLVGGSSTGKSTAAHVARSVWGAGLQSWRATDNGLEGVASRHSDCGLVLDEIGQVDGRIVGEIAYMLANGQGKGRAARDGGDRARLSWRLLFLSTGETTLARHMGETGKKAKAGQELRLVSIEADAGAGMGLFENVHAAASPGAFADALVSACAANHGHAGPAFVERLVGEIDAARATIEQVRERFDRETGLSEASGQVQRVGRRLALIGAAGELATAYGLTGWERGTALGAAVECFAAWRASWTPAGSHEAAQAIEQVRAFLQRHAARFETHGHDHERFPIHNRAGYRDGGEWLVFPDVFKGEVCNGLRPNAVADALEAAGVLVTETNGDRKVRQVRRSVGEGRQRLYAVRESILDEGGDDA